AASIFIIPENDLRQVQIRLSDFSGKTIQQWNLDLIASNILTSLNLESLLQNGTYILTVENSKLHFADKILVFR
ncbi:MAG: T9SS type A sorting domain-containing protein, partial [Saprospiraceae bacterium]